MFDEPRSLWPMMNWERQWETGCELSRQDRYLREDAVASNGDSAKGSQIEFPISNFGHRTASSRKSEIRKF